MILLPCYVNVLMLNHWDFFGCLQLMFAVIKNDVKSNTISHLYFYTLQVWNGSWVMGHGSNIDGSLGSKLLTHGQL